MPRWQHQHSVPSVEVGQGHSTVSLRRSLSLYSEFQSELVFVIHSPNENKMVSKLLNSAGEAEEEEETERGWANIDLKFALISFALIHGWRCNFKTNDERT